MPMWLIWTVAVVAAWLALALVFGAALGRVMAVEAARPRRPDAAGHRARRDEFSEIGGSLPRRPSEPPSAEMPARQMPPPRRPFLLPRRA